MALRQEGTWAEPVRAVHVSATPAGAMNANVEGREIVGPLQGFGQMWQKTYRVRLDGIQSTPAEVVQTWKANFPQFWPRDNRFYAPLTGIKPGEVALINAALGGVMPLSTGVMVIYADDQSFTLMTTQGHPFSGWITFSADDQDRVTAAQVQLLIRANDPLYEIGMRLGASQTEDRFWQHTLKALARWLGVDGKVWMQITCVDRRVQWSRIGNIWHNAAIRTPVYILTTPVRWIGRRITNDRQ